MIYYSLILICVRIISFFAFPVFQLLFLSGAPWLYLVVFYRVTLRIEKLRNNNTLHIDQLLHQHKKCANLCYLIFENIIRPSSGNNLQLRFNFLHQFQLIILYPIVNKHHVDKHKHNKKEKHLGYNMVEH